MGMIPSSTEILNQIIRTTQLHPDWTVSEIAQHLGFSPIFVINALNMGEATEKVTRNFKKDTIKVINEHPAYESMLYPYGEEVDRIVDEIHRAISFENSIRQQDLETGLVAAWLGGVRPAVIELAIDYLVLTKRLAQYELADPEDKKSVYTFLTLPTNEDKQWGAKQFKKRPKKTTKKK